MSAPSGLRARRAARWGDADRDGGACLAAVDSRARLHDEQHRAAEACPMKRARRPDANAAEPPPLDQMRADCDSDEAVLIAKRKVIEALATLPDDDARRRVIKAAAALLGFL